MPIVNFNGNFIKAFSHIKICTGKELVMGKNERLKVIEIQGYIQGKELVKRFIKGCYKIKIETITGGENLIRYNLSLIIPKETRYNFYKKN